MTGSQIFSIMSTWSLILDNTLKQQSSLSIEILVLHREGTWSGVISIPRDCNVMFRYFVGIVFKPDEENFTSRQVIVRRWETNLNPRVIHKEGMYLVICYIFFLLLHTDVWRKNIWWLLQLFQIINKWWNQTSLAYMTAARWQTEGGSLQKQWFSLSFLRIPYSSGSTNMKEERYSVCILFHFSSLGISNWSRPNEEWQYRSTPLILKLISFNQNTSLTCPLFSFQTSTWSIRMSYFTSHLHSACKWTD